MATVSERRDLVLERFVVRGMTCAGCASRVKQALLGVTGVESADVDLATATAVVRRDPGVNLQDSLSEAVGALGYTLEKPGPATVGSLPWRPALVGVLAAGGLLAFYLGVITLAQGWEHATQQLSEDRWFIAALSAGFGVQAG
ncbi:MAG: heavy-metal-associated domain-containing protein, partial [Chloroflexota bacterium]